MLKLMTRIIPLLLLLLFACVNQASAQGLSAYFGLGSATDGQASDPTCPAPHQLFDSFSGNCESSPTLGGVFGVFGADFMIKPHFGINGEYSFRFAQANFFPVAGLNVRPAFYDFNAVYQPTSPDSRIVPVIEGGIGGARLTAYLTQQCTVAGFNCTSSYPAGFSANHFAVHGAVGVKIYVSGDIFIKPQFDARYVRNLNQQYGRDFVPEYTVSIGYTFGRH